MLRKSLFVFILLFSIAPIAAAQLNVGYMNPQDVLSQLEERQEIEQQLNDFIEEKRAELETNTADFQNAVAEYQQKASSMSEEQRSKEEERLATMEQELQEYQRGIQNQMQQKRTELLSPLLRRMDEAIKEVADDRGLDFVINKSTGNGESIIFYAAEGTVDITSAVLAKLRN
ncbi:MAG: OmpH family outer membrane protein [Bacteroidota bacterium]